MKLTPILLSASLLISVAPGAYAQAMQPAPAAPTMVTAQTAGTLTRYIIGPGGHVRGFVLDNGAIVFVHGRSGDTLAQQLPVGQSVRVSGTAPASTPHVIHHATISAANGTVLSAPPAGAGANGAFEPGRGEGHGDPARRAAHRAHLAQLPAESAHGVVQVVIPGPRGGIRGLLLSDGTSVFLAGPMVRQATQHGVRVGEAVQVTGRGGAYPQGTAVFAERLTFADGTTIAAPIAMAPSAP